MNRRAILQLFTGASAAAGTALAHPFAVKEMAGDASIAMPNLPAIEHAKQIKDAGALVEYAAQECGDFIRERIGHRVVRIDFETGMMRGDSIVWQTVKATLKHIEATVLLRSYECLQEDSLRKGQLAPACIALCDMIDRSAGRLLATNLPLPVAGGGVLGANSGGSIPVRALLSFSTVSLTPLLTIDMLYGVLEPLQHD